MVLVTLLYCKSGRNPEPMTGIVSITWLNLTRFDDILRTNLVKYLIKYKFRKMQFRKSENTFRGLARKHKIIWNFISIFRFWLILSVFLWQSGFYRANNIIWKDCRKTTFIKINVKKTYFILFVSRLTLCDDLLNNTQFNMSHKVTRCLQIARLQMI